MIVQTPPSLANAPSASKAPNLLVSETAPDAQWSDSNRQSVSAFVRTEALIAAISQPLHLELLRLAGRAWLVNST